MSSSADEEQDRTALRLQRYWSTLPIGWLPKAYAYLASQVTVVSRGSYRGAQGPHELSVLLSEADKLHGFNEVQHQVTNELLHVVTGSRGIPQDQFVLALLRHAALWRCRDEIVWALNWTLRWVTDRMDNSQPINPTGALAGITIRPAEARDLPAINTIYNHFVRTSTGTFDLDPIADEVRARWFEAHGERYPVFVAELDATVIAWASVSQFASRPGYDQTVEDSVYVAEEWQRMGIGTALLHHVVAAARELGYHAVIARIGDSENAASIGLHRAAGFERVGTEREVGLKFGRWVDVVVMELLLG